MFISPFHPQTSVHWFLSGSLTWSKCNARSSLLNCLHWGHSPAPKLRGRKVCRRFGALPSSHHTWLAGDLRKKCWWWKSHLEMVDFPLPRLIAVYVFHMSEYVSRSLPAIASFHRRKLRRMDRSPVQHFILAIPFFGLHLYSCGAQNIFSTLNLGPNSFQAQF